MHEPGTYGNSPRANCPLPRPGFHHTIAPARERQLVQEACHVPARVPILYLILGVLILVSVVPMYFYAGQVMSINRDRLKTNEMYLQNTITQSVGEDIEHRQRSLETMLGNLTVGHRDCQRRRPARRACQRPRVARPAGEVRFFLHRCRLRHRPQRRCQGHLRRPPHARRFPPQGDGACLHRRQPGPRLHRTGPRPSIPAASAASWCCSACRSRRAVGLSACSAPPSTSDFLRVRLQEVANFGGLLTYVVDRQGRLVAGATSNYATGQDMTKFEIVKNFVEVRRQGRGRDQGIYRHPAQRREDSPCSAPSARCPRWSGR